MSGHWHKVVSGACKPKHAPPKAKYIDALVSATYQSDGSLEDVSRALSHRLRDPSATVVFKALIVIHTLIRAGNAEEVMPYWSGSDGRDGRALGLSGVVSSHDTPQNLERYAKFLDNRLRCYSAIRYDPIRARAEAPARLRNGNGGGANRLRILTVEKGLLREVGTLQKLLDSLVECKFYLEDTDDDVVMTAFRLLVKDLLVLFQAVNEGVINVLEHYFEMSRVDATTSLKIYKIFCRQCEKVVAFLGVAKKMQNIINVNVPNLRHAPVSLAGSLQEYLDDPNFEKNREEYKENKRIADGKAPAKAPTAAPTSPPAASTSAAAPSASTPAASGASEPAKSFTDFFASIESEQQSMFNPQTGSPSVAYFQQQAHFNPFLQEPPQQMGMGTGMNMGMGMGAGGMALQPQPTGFPGASTSMGQSLFGIQPQATGFPLGGGQQMGGIMGPVGGGTQSGFLVPQQTGSNPFRQSMVVPQPTDYNPFLAQSAGPLGSPGGGLPDRANGAMSAPPLQFQPTGFPSASSSPFSQPPTSSPAPLVAQPTGSRNPFAPPPGDVPPVPKLPAQPSLNALAQSAWTNAMTQQQVRDEAARLQAAQGSNGGMETLASSNGANSGGGGQGPAPQDAANRDKSNAFGDFFASQLSKLEGAGRPSAEAQKVAAAGGGVLSSVASEFAVTRPKSAGDSPHPWLAAPSSAPSVPGAGPTGTGSGLLGGFGTGAEPGTLVSQPTGFGGSSVKPFKPSSSFGASLASSLPPVPEDASATAAAVAGPSSSSPWDSGSLASLGAQPTGSPGAIGGSSSNGIGGGSIGLLGPHPAGAGAANPFRMSALPTGSGSTITAGSGALSSQPTGFSAFSAFSQGTASTAASSAVGAGAPGSGFGGIKPFQPTSSFGQSQFGTSGGVAPGGQQLGSQLQPQAQPQQVNLMGFE